MSVVGRWRIIEMPDYDADYPDMMVTAFIQLKADGSAEFAFGCVTGQIWRRRSDRCIVPLDRQRPDGRSRCRS